MSNLGSKILTYLGQGFYMLTGGKCNHCLMLYISDPTCSNISSSRYDTY